MIVFFTLILSLIPGISSHSTRVVFFPIMLFCDFAIVLFKADNSNTNVIIIMKEWLFGDKCIHITFRSIISTIWPRKRLSDSANQSRSIIGLRSESCWVTSKSSPPHVQNPYNYDNCCKCACMHTVQINIGVIFSIIGISKWRLTTAELPWYDGCYQDWKVYRFSDINIVTNFYLKWTYFC